MKYIAIILMALAMAACNQGEVLSDKPIDGKYISSSGKEVFTFEGDGRVKIESSGLGIAKTHSYSVHGNVLTINGDYGVSRKYNIEGGGSIVAADSSKDKFTKQ